MSGYPGSKAGAGVRQQIISLMPPHQLYVEPFFGSGQIFYAKKAAEFSIVADLDRELIASHSERIHGMNAACLVADALELLPSLKLTVRDLVYADPPYHPETRSNKKMYRYELGAQLHTSLLTMLQELRCRVILSGYRHPTYDDALKNWHRLDYRAMTRGGVRTESAWCNFEPGMALHDARFVGSNFRERERIKRKKSRWVSRFVAMPTAERAVIAEALATAAAIAASAGATGNIAANDGAAASPGAASMASP